MTDGQHTGNAEGTPLVVGGGKNFMHPGNCFDLNYADMKDLFYTFSTFLNLGFDQLPRELQCALDLSCGAGARSRAALARWPFRDA